jgi:hypothetical protein
VRAHSTIRALVEHDDAIDARIVESRCAMTRAVRSFMTASRAACIFFSVFESMLAVASSSTTIGVSR